MSLEEDRLEGDKREEVKVYEEGKEGGKRGGGKEENEPRI